MAKTNVETNAESVVIHMTPDTETGLPEVSMVPDANGGLTVEIPRSSVQQAHTLFAGLSSAIGGLRGLDQIKG